MPKYTTLFIPNVSTDVGLTPPYNSLFTFFGQFFDHGLDQAVKGGGTVFVPLQADDPLIPGADHVLGTDDDLPADQRFMVLTRAQNQPGPDGILGDRNPTTGPATPCTALNTPAGCDESADDVQEATNTDSPWIDQSQTYSSHPSHQVFLRQYANNVVGQAGFDWLLDRRQWCTGDRPGHLGRPQDPGSNAPRAQAVGCRRAERADDRRRPVRQRSSPALHAACPST